MCKLCCYISPYNDSHNCLSVISSWLTLDDIQVCYSWSRTGCASASCSQHSSHWSYTARFTLCKGYPVSCSYFFLQSTYFSTFGSPSNLPPQQPHTLPSFLSPCSDEWSRGPPFASPSTERWCSVYVLIHQTPSSHPTQRQASRTQTSSSSSSSLVVVKPDETEKEACRSRSRSKLDIDWSIVRGHICYSGNNENLSARVSRAQHKFLWRYRYFRVECTKSSRMHSQTSRATARWNSQTGMVCLTEPVTAEPADVESALTLTDTHSTSSGVSVCAVERMVGNATQLNPCLFRLFQTKNYGWRCLLQSDHHVCFGLRNNKKKLA